MKTLDIAQYLIPFILSAIGPIVAFQEILFAPLNVKSLPREAKLRPQFFIIGVTIILVFMGHEY